MVTFGLSDQALDKTDPVSAELFRVPCIEGAKGALKPLVGP